MSYRLVSIFFLSLLFFALLLDEIGGDGKLGWMDGWSEVTHNTTFIPLSPSLEVACGL